EAAIEHLARAMRLSPLDWETYGFQGSTGYAHLFCGRYSEASIWAERAIRENPNFLPVCIIAAASNALAGRIKEAKTALEKLRFQSQRSAFLPPSGRYREAGRRAAKSGFTVRLATPHAI